MKTIFVGHNATDLRRRNRGAILSAILKFAPISRRDLGRLTGLNGATITHITRELIEQHLIREVGSPDPPVQRQRGPREILLDINADGALVGGIQIGIRTLAVALVNLRAEIRADRWLVDRAEMNPAEILDWVHRGLAELAAGAGITPAQLAGVGIVVTGLGDPLADTQMAEIARACLGSGPDHPLAAIWGVPVFVDNNVRAMAMAEVWFGAGRDVADLLLFWLGNVVGCGVVLSHQLPSGRDYAAGHIGHVTGPWQGGVLCRCGNRGCLETAVSQPAIARRAIAAASPGSLLFRLIEGQSERMQWQMAIEATRQGDAAARRVLNEVAWDLGQAIANVAAVLSPRRIVLAGPVVDEAGELFVEPLRKTLRARRVIGSTAPLDVVPSSFGRSIGLVGAATLALQAQLYAPEGALAPRMSEKGSPNGRGIRREVLDPVGSGSGRLGWRLEEVLP